ncbi:hypothetical protein D3C81_1804190 [compost metagenome]
MDEAKLAFGVVRDVDEFANSEWSNWWGAIEAVDNRAGGVAKIPGKPWRFSGGSLDHPGIPAFRGEHNREVMREMGLTDAQIQDLEARNVLTSDPIIR